MNNLLILIDWYLNNCLIWKLEIEKSDYDITNWYILKKAVKQLLRFKCKLQFEFWKLFEKTRFSAAILNVYDQTGSRIFELLFSTNLYNWTWIFFIKISKHLNLFQFFILNVYNKLSFVIGEYLINFWNLKHVLIHHYFHKNKHKKKDTSKHSFFFKKMHVSLNIMPYVCLLNVILKRYSKKWIHFSDYIL